MRTLLLAGVALVVLSGCGNDMSAKEQQEHDAKVAQEAREALLKELQAKERATQEAQAKEEKQMKLEQIGIQTTPDGKIIIDTNKTKSFFEKLAQKMRQKMEKMADDLQKGAIEQKEAGIEITPKKIEIDLNKTETFLQQLSQKMEGFVKEFDKIAGELNATHNKKGE